MGRNVGNQAIDVFVKLGVRPIGLRARGVCHGEKIWPRGKRQFLARKMKFYFISTFVPHLDLFDRVSVTYDATDLVTGRSLWDLNDWAVGRVGDAQVGPYRPRPEVVAARADLAPPRDDVLPAGRAAAPVVDHRVVDDPIAAARLQERQRPPRHAYVAKQGVDAIEVSFPGFLG